MGRSTEAERGSQAAKPRRERRDGESVKRPNHVDAHVARRMRLRRVLLGLSQEELAKRLGLTPQQVQKYEAGETRISASRLYAIAGHLAVSLTWFFEELEADGPDGAPETPAGTPDISELMGRREARELVQAYFSIADARVRRKVLEMADLLRKNER